MNSQAYTVALEPGTYTFQVASGSTDTFNFTLTQQGIIAIDEADASYVTIEGGTKLLVRGFEVRVDARYVGDKVIWNGNQYQGQPSIVFDTYRMIPMSGYMLAKNDYNCSFSFAIDKHGLFQYETAYEYKGDGSPGTPTSGFLQGQGTSTLTLLGYPLLIDARSAGGKGVAIDPAQAYGGLASTNVMLLNVLPIVEFELDLGYGGNAAASFLMDLEGNITPTTKLPYRFAVDRFHGISRITVEKVFFEVRQAEPKTEDMPALVSSSR